VIELTNDPIRPGIVLASLNRKRALTNSREHQVFAEVLGYPASMSEPAKPCRSQDDCIVLPFVELAKPRVNVAANRFDHQVWTDCPKLCLTPKTARAYLSALWEVAERFDGFASDKRIPGVLALANGSYVQAGGEFSWDVFKAVYSKVNALLENRIFEFLGEQALALLSQFWKRDVKHAIAFG
jgi:hypothetical protein